jgi:hypothetical protein
MITQADLKEILNYNPATGVFVWKKALARRLTVGDIAGCEQGCGYIRIRICNKNYYAHRLAWLYVHGAWPELDIDHINGCRDDNRIDNLRLATQTQNNGNTRIPSHNSSGVKGVHWSTKERRWVVQIHQNNWPKRIGAFKDIEAAKAAYAEAAKSYFGEFARVA